MRTLGCIFNQHLAALLTSYQFTGVRIPIKYGGRVTRCSISSFATAGLWRRSGNRDGDVSEIKGNALA